MYFRLVPKSVPLNGIMGLILQNLVAFGANYIQVVEDRPILSATEV